MPFSNLAERGVGASDNHVCLRRPCAYCAARRGTPIPAHALVGYGGPACVCAGLEPRLRRSLRAIAVNLLRRAPTRATWRVAPRVIHGRKPVRP